MNRKDKFVLVKNAVANVARGGAAAFVAILLPPFLTRMMAPDAFGAWSLVLQVSAFVAYLDFGIQTAVGRFVAHANEKGDSEFRDRIVSTSFAALSAAGVLAICGSIGIAALLPHFFRQMPAALVGDARVAFLLVAVSLAVGLPASVFIGVFVGLQRNEVPAAIIGGSRILSALCLILVVRRGGALVSMGAIVAIVNLASYVAQYWLYRRLGGGIVLSRRLVSVTTGRELSGYCVSLSIWSFAMLLVSGLDVALVGHFEFGKVAYYSVAATLIVFLAGVQNAVFNVMIPSTAILQARGDAVQLGQAMLTATRYGSFLLLLMGLPLILGAKSILSVWVGPRYADQGARILEMLAAANIIRLSAVPYIMTLIGTGQQRLVTITPLLEGVSNLVVSVIGGFFFGAIGVAIGTLLGGTVGVLGNFVYNMPRTIEINFRISDYVRDGFLRPLVCALPLSGATLAIRVSDFFIGLNGYLLVGAAAVGTAFLLWRWGLVGSERERLRSWYAVLVEA